MSLNAILTSSLNDDTFSILQILVQIDQILEPSDSQSLKPTVAPTLIHSSVPSVDPSGAPNRFSVPSLKPSYLHNKLLSLSPNDTPSLDASYGPSLNQSGSLSLFPSAVPNGLPRFF